ncbi:MAG: DUF1080 domain-containing protein [Bacteroidales bacterium]|nr:DUF1080 domain-containing protein [Bacteroidales bacterium]
MRKPFISITLLSILIGSSQVIYSCKSAGTGGDTTNTEEIMNTLTQAEQEEGWILMFDGQTTSGWRGYNRPAFPESGWVVEDGTLRCTASVRGDTGRVGGNIIYNTKFQDFHLKLEWKIDSAGNSGIFYLGQEIADAPIWHSAPEMQVLDNERHPDANLGMEGTRKAGSLYDLIPAIPQNSKPALEWNSIEIIVEQGHVVHMMNGVQVVEYQMGTPEWNELVSHSKFSELPEFGKYREGFVGLQDHGNNVWYRNIKIKPL